MEKPTKDYAVQLMYVLVIAASAFSYFLPGVPEVVHPEAHHWRMVFTLGMVTSFCGSAILFLRGLGAFKEAMRRAYIWFAVGMILFGLGLLQWPVMVMRGLTNSFWANSGLMILPLVCAGAFMYNGLGKFAKLLEIRTGLTRSFVAVAGVTSFAALSAAAFWLFIATGAEEDFGRAAYTATVGWALGFAVLTWLIAAKVEHSIGSAYRPAMNWLKINMGLMAVSGLHEYATSYFLTEDDWYIYSGVSLWPLIFSGLLLVWTAYSFDKLTHIRTSTETVSNPDSDQAIINSITNTASLASQPAEIDVMLDDLRRVTANFAPGSKLTLPQQHTLAALYLKLERFLMTSDPVRSFTPNELRRNIDPALLSLLEQVETPAEPANTQPVLQA